jgi:tRNA pseudouridine55 synthase
VRTLAEDLGKRLGVGAHVVELRRTRAGDFDLKRATTLEKLEEHKQRESLDDILITPDVAVDFLPCVLLTGPEVRRTQQGLPLKLESKPAFGDADWVRMRDEAGALVAVGTYDPEGDLVRPRVVLSLEQ